MRVSRLLKEPGTLIMGILNVTPDSFSDGGAYFDLESAVDHAYKMVNEGADIIDIGGESSRPGAEPVTLEEEEKRVIPVLERLVGEIDVPISVDTYKSTIAKKALEFGTQIINDISGLTFDPDMAYVVAEYDCHVVIMHMKGSPKDMQLNPTYFDLMSELVTFFEERIGHASAQGISGDKIILDPGIGFGKRVEDNFVIIRELESIVELGYPVIVGPSRKSFLSKTLNLPSEDLIEGTSAAVTASIINGAKIVRVHDVKKMKRVVTIADTFQKSRVLA